MLTTKLLDRQTNNLMAYEWTISNKNNLDLIKETRTTIFVIQSYKICLNTNI